MSLSKTLASLRSGWVSVRAVMVLVFSASVLHCRHRLYTPHRELRCFKEFNGPVIRVIMLEALCDMVEKALYMKTEYYYYYTMMDIVIFNA